HEERRMSTDDEPSGPLGLVAEQLYATAFTAHRYGVPIIGWPSDIDHITRTEVESFFRKYYAPNRMTLAIVGDIDPDKTFEIEKVKKGPIDDRELETAKTKYRQGFVDGLVDNLGLAGILAQNQGSLGDWREGFRRADLVSKVTAADVQRVAATYLKATNRTV